MGDTGELLLAGCIRYGVMRNEVWSTGVTHSSHVEASFSRKILLFRKVSSIFLVQIHGFTGTERRRQEKNCRASV